ncbi:SLIT-ROBO Rho GTPase-activating 1-like isoform X3 [Brachionus plicatilis]|uniref:SLIT-ROBO Rho GTPase-activating 1-like isoform X3 n=1 Tax=Brachionus plicatilis TaxID=10195 RepID=A0A3M7T6B8_BRAPC|nr:SLIT-ROBO Rho GTPase-activating 1-like isoform X3 [Brachionus plicatilis]
MSVALYDYNGRSEKELTFKKGSILAIRGQLSADWWQGSLLSPSSSATINSSTPTRIGYIPDKYIALRSSRKRIRSNASTPQTSLSQSSKANTSALMSTSMKDSLMSAKQPSGLASSSLNNISTPPSSRTVNEFSDIKESDILDDDNDSCSFTQYNSFRSMSIASQNTCTLPVKQRNYSTNSALSGYSTNTQNSQLSYYTMRTAKSDEQSSLDEILSNGKKKLKMNQIEDALASVLDDMKQLDFAKQEPKRPDLVIDLPLNYNTPTGAKNQAGRSFSLSAERSDKSDEPLKSVSTTSTESSLTSSSTSSIRLENEKFDKKKPPPLMKKPDKSEELMKKLGKSPSETNQSECESPTGSMQSSKPALATRLSNSKATDV